MELYDYLNFVSNEPRLYINNKTRYSNTFSVVMGVLTILSILSLSLIFIINFLQGKNFNMVTNQSTKLSPSLDMAKVPLMFRINSAFGDIYSENITHLVAQKWTFPKEDLSKPIRTTLPIERCSRDKHLSNFTDILKDFQVEQFYCLNTDASNLTIYGRAQDTINSNSYLMIFAVKCLNNSIYKPNNKTCESDSLITSKVGALPHFINFAFLDNAIDNDNIENPISYYIKTANLPVGLTLLYRHLMYLKKVFYSSDIGYIFEDIKTQEFHQFDKQISEVYLTPFTVPGAYALLTITFNEVGNFHTRTFEKLQTVFANIGGIFKGIIVIATAITRIFSGKHYLVFLNNFISQESRPISLHTNNSNNNLVTYKSFVPLSSVVRDFKKEDLPLSSMARDFKKENLQKESYDDIKIPKKQIKLKKFEIFCPSLFVKNSSNLKSLSAFEKTFKNKMSLENILMLIFNIEFNFKIGQLKEYMPHKTKTNLLQIFKDKEIEPSENKIYIRGSKKDIIK